MPSGAASSPNIITELTCCRQSLQSTAVCGCVSKSNLFVEPEHGADHGDIRKGDPLSHKEGTGVEVLIQHSEELFHILLGLLCGLERDKQGLTKPKSNFVYSVPSNSKRVYYSRYPSTPPY